MRKRQPKRILNVNPSPKTDEDWTFQTAEEADMVVAAPAIPSSKDLRTTWWKVADQGSTGLRRVGDRRLGAALAFRQGRAHHPERRALAALRLDGLEGDDPFVAADDVHRDRGHEPQSGARHRPQVRRRPRLGAAVLVRQLYAGEANTFYAIAAQLKILAYFNLGTNLTNWRTWLATKGPILTRLSVDSTWDRRRRNAGNLDDYKPETARGGHAVALVGYRPGRFIVRNSWGTSWGQSGFAYASLAYAQEAFTEAYGVEI